MDLRPTWSSKNEALYIGDRPDDAKWCMGVVDGDQSSKELVALAWGYSPEGVAKRANLIAAAPDMLEALLSAFDDDLNFNPTAVANLCGLARAAIRKAHGGHSG